MSKRRSTAALESLAQPWLRAWERCWRTPGLATTVRVEPSPLLRRSLARATLATGRIRLSSEFVSAPSALLREVLCHEAAHIAAYWLHGPGIRPHGPEWAVLMQRAGFAPARKLPALSPAPPSRFSASFEHRCPVCQARRLARRSMPSWRCASCVELGLPGIFTITRLSPRADRVL